VIISKQRFHS